MKAATFTKKDLRKASLLIARHINTPSALSEALHIEEQALMKVFSVGSYSFSEVAQAVAGAHLLSESRPQAWDPEKPSREFGENMQGFLSIAATLAYASVLTRDDVIKIIGSVNKVCDLDLNDCYYRDHEDAEKHSARRYELFGIFVSYAVLHPFFGDMVMNSDQEKFHAYLKGVRLVT